MNAKPKVKALPWEDNGTGGDVWTDVLIFNTYYTVERAGDGLWEANRHQMLSEYRNERVGVFPSFDAAKEAAQMDFSATVLSMLED